MPGPEKPGPIRSPRSLTEAQRLCELYAAADAFVAEIEAARDGQIAAANALADQQLAPVLVQRAAIASKLEPWWAENAALLTQGKRKSAELGGVVLGTRKGNPPHAPTGGRAEAYRQALLAAPPRHRDHRDPYRATASAQAQSASDQTPAGNLHAPCFYLLKSPA